MKSKKLWILLVLSVIVFSLTGCADVTVVPQAVVANSHIYGFWGGLWHGMILPFAWVGQLFSDNIAMYAIANNGGWYNFGFFLGAGSFVSGFVRGTIGGK
jgi:hypothetical protein